MDEDSFLGVDISTLKLHMRSGAVYRLSTTLDGLDLEQMQEWIEYAMQLHALDEEAEDGQTDDSASDEDVGDDEPESEPEDKDDDKDEPQGTGSVVSSLIDNVISWTNSIIPEDDPSESD
jgi:hypothetical protein